jgi:hypothetical protein
MPPVAAERRDVVVAHASTGSDQHNGGALGGIHSLPPDSSLVYTSQGPHAQGAMSMPLNPTPSHVILSERGNDMGMPYPLPAHHTMGMPGHAVAAERRDVDHVYAAQQRQNMGLPRTASSERRDVNLHPAQDQHQNMYACGQSVSTERRDVNVTSPYMHQHHNMVLPRAVSSEAREMAMVYNAQLPNTEAQDMNVNMAYMAQQHQVHCFLPPCACVCA